MNWTRRALDSWNRFWFTAADPYPVACFRILLGIYLLCYLGSMLAHVELLFSNHGVYAPYLVPDYAPDPWLAQLLFLTMLAACGAMVVGYRTSLAALLLLALFLHHYFLQLAVKQSSFDRLIMIYLAVLALSDAGRVWGFDRGPSQVTRWTRRILLAQTFALYFGSGLWKAMNGRWHGPHLLASTLQGMWATPVGFAIARLDLSDGQWTAASYCVIFFELALGCAFLWRRTRLIAIVGGTLFHVTNTVVISIPEFLLCVTAYPLFLPDGSVQRWAAALSFRIRGASAPGTPS